MQVYLRDLELSEWQKQKMVFKDGNMISERKGERTDPRYNKEEWLQDERLGLHK